MNVRSKIIILAFTGLTSLASSLALKELGTQIATYKAGAYHCTELGNQAADKYLQDLAYLAMSSMGVKKQPLFNIYKGTGTSCAASWHMWLDPLIIPGPWEFVVFHEAAHVALGHFDIRVQREIDSDEARAQEVEADLLACQKLFELGMKDVIIERVRQIKHCINNRSKQDDLGTHPTFKEIDIYLCEFLKSKGIIVK